MGKAAFVNDVLEQLPEPKPAYNTVSTFMRILVTKGFVGYKAFGKSHQYYPLVSREAYMDYFLSGVKNTFFRGSFQSMISFFAKREIFFHKVDQRMLLAKVVFPPLKNNVKVVDFIEYSDNDGSETEWSFRNIDLSIYKPRADNNTTGSGAKVYY